MLHKEIAEIGGKKLAFVRQNDWSEDVILFFHGFFGSKEYFPELESVKDCIVSFDRPGIGESDVCAYYTMDDFLKNVHQVLKSNGVKTVRLAGHSGGGYYAQVYASMFPDEVTSLSLLSSMIPINCPKTKKLVGGSWKFVRFLSLKAKRVSRWYFSKAAKSVTKDYEKALSANMKKLPEPERKFMEDNPELIKTVIMNAVKNNGLGICHDAYALCVKREAVNIPGSIPVYVWHGGADSDVPFPVTEYYKAEYNVKELHKIEGLGHMLYLPYWADIIAEIRR